MAVGKFLKSEILKIEDKISDIEEKSSIEIVPCVLRHSDNYSSAFYRCAIFFMILSYCLFFYFGDEDWLTYAISGGLIFGGMISFFPLIKRYFIFNDEKIEEVKQRATQLFYELDIHYTSQRNGILLFVSLLERRVQVLADKGIASEVDQSYWDEIVLIITKQIKKGDVLTGLLHAMTKIQTDFAGKFPKVKTTENELSNKFITDLKIID